MNTYNTIQFFTDIVLILGYPISLHFIYLTYHRILTTRHSSVLSYIIFQIVLNSLNVCITVLVPNAIVAQILIILTLILTILALFIGKFLNICLILLLTASVQSLLESLFLYTIGAVWDQPVLNSAPTFLIAGMMAPFYFWLTYRLVALIFKSIHLLPKQMLILLLFYGLDLYFLSFISSSSMYFNAKKMTSLLLLFILNLFFLVVAIFLFCNLYHVFYNEQQCLHLERENKLLTEQYALFLEKEEKERKLRHDIKNHLLTIDTLLETGSKEAALHYYEQLKGRHQSL